MIRINLLPEEYRKKARTPFKMMLAVSGAVAINATALAYWAWMTFGITAELTDTGFTVSRLELPNSDHSLPSGLHCQARFVAPE